MYAYLSGILRSKRPHCFVVEVQGIGYKVNVPTPLWEKTEIQSPIELHLHTIVREDELSLYGFEQEKELKLFELFLSVNGVGPRLASDLLSWPIERIKKAILDKDVATIKQVKGIGKKTAERIILELREKMGALDSDNLPELEDQQTSDIQEDVAQALFGLGYQRRDMERVFRSLTTPLENSEEMIKYFLKHV